MNAHVHSCSSRTPPRARRPGSTHGGRRSRASSPELPLPTEQQLRLTDSRGRSRVLRTPPSSSAALLREQRSRGRRSHADEQQPRSRSVSRATSRRRGSAGSRRSRRSQSRRKTRGCSRHVERQRSRDSSRARSRHSRRSRSRQIVWDRSRRSVYSRGRNSGAARNRKSRYSLSRDRSTGSWRTRSRASISGERSRIGIHLHTRDFCISPRSYGPADRPARRSPISGHRTSQQEFKQYSASRGLAPDGGALSINPKVASDSGVILSQLVQALSSFNSQNTNDKLSNHNTVPEFDPTKKEQTVEMWLHKVNECAVIYNWTDRQTIHFALPKMKGLAQKWYEGLPTVLYSWQEWQDKLKLAFPSYENYGQSLTTMLAKRARFNDSLEEYYYEKTVLLNRCGISGKRAVDCIVYGIDDRSVRLGAEAARFESPDQLLPFLKTIRNGNVSVDRKKNKNFEVKSDSAGKTGSKDRIVKCFNCSQEGHYRSQCTKPAVKCDRCSRYGHTSDKCNIAKSTNNENKSTRPVLLVNSSEPESSKYYKRASVNGFPLNCLIDFGSSATMLTVAGASGGVCNWETDYTLPCLKGFGGAIVRPLGKSRVEIEVDSTKATVDVVIVPDGIMQVPLLLGQTYTEQPHILVEKDSSSLRIMSNDNVYDTRISLICISDVIIDGLTMVDVRTDPVFSGDLCIEGRNSFLLDREHVILQGLFTIVDGTGITLIKGLSGLPFHVKQGTLLARCKPYTPDSNKNRACDVLGIEKAEQPRAITENDLISDGTMDENNKMILLSLLNKYRSCFAFGLNELGKTDLVEMSIQLKDDEPVVYRPYRLPFSERDKVRDMIQELLDCDVIRPSHSSYASPIVLVKKKTGDIRLCVDYRALNRKTVKENYPLPRIDDQLDDLAGYSFYTTLDLASGYYQVAIKESDRHKTSFVTPDGQFEFNRMPFGLVNAPSVFMRMINLVLNDANPITPHSRTGSSGERKKIASAYMDDVIVPSVSIEEGLQRLESVLRLFQRAGLTLKLSKCCFFSKTVEYLGFELNADGIRPGTRKIEAVRDFPEPSNQHGVRQFIGLCSFFRRFVRGFSVIAKPLTSLLKKGAAWTWDVEQVEAFKKLKEELLRKSTLALYDPTAQTELHTDACKIGIAGILLQRDKNGLLKPVAYFSRQTTIDEQHMTSYELETLAVIASLQRFRVYLIGIEFKIYTDCNSLRATFLKRDLIPRVARWWIAMQEFNFNIEYRPGKSMTYVDALSRNPPPSDCTGRNDINDVVMEVTEVDWLSTVQSGDSEIQRKLSILKDPQTDDIIDIKTNYSARNNKLYRKTDQGERWVVPKGVRWQILKQCHDDIGHFAFEKTLAKVQETYWFGKMRRFVKKYVESCLECAYAKSSSGKKPPLHPIPKDDTPFVTLHIDHVGPFVKSAKGNTHLLVVIDSFTKFIVLKPVKSTKASIVVDKMREYFSIFGIPKRIISDRGSCFTSSKFTSYLQKLGIKHVLNAVATPRANGQVERYNRTLLEALTAKCAGLDEKKWDEHVPDVQLGLNNTVNKGIGNKTPAQALFGASLTGITEGRIKAYLDSEHMTNSETIDDIRKEINEYVAIYQEKQKSTYDRKARNPKNFQVGDLVSVEREAPATGQSRKLVPKFQGPYRITAVLGNDRYQVEDTPISRKGNRSYSAVVAVDKMKSWLHFNRSHVDSSSSDGED